MPRTERPTIPSTAISSPFLEVCQVHFTAWRLGWKIERYRFYQSRKRILDPEKFRVFSIGISFKQWCLFFLRCQHVSFFFGKNLSPIFFSTAWVSQELEVRPVQMWTWNAGEAHRHFSRKGSNSQQPCEWKRYPLDLPRDHPGCNSAKMKGINRGFPYQKCKVFMVVNWHGHFYSEAKWYCSILTTG